MKLMVNGRVAEVPLHRRRANEEMKTEDVCFKRSRKMGVDILRSNCCDYVGEIRGDTDFVSIGRQYAGCKRLILNYLSNEGGYNRMMREFIKGLNGYVHCPEYSWKLISPVTEGKACRREWVKLSDPSPYAREKGVYDGTCIMLVNSNTASAGETAVLYGKSLRNFILVGENTMGCNTFGNVAGYTLRNSRILCRIPNVINLCENPGDCEEGRGFTPDFWVDSTDVEGEVLRWLGDRRDSLF